MNRTVRAIALVAALGVAGAAAALALAAGAPPAPAITSGPSDPTSATSATFAFSDAQAGVTFECSLDGSSFTACAGPTSYSGLAAGGHAFQVRARNTAGATSAAKSYTWTVDTAAPSIAIAFPAGGGSYNAGSWSPNCPGVVGLCGSASDPSGVATVALSMRQAASGRWWGGTSFDRTSETFLTATGTTSWRFALAVPTQE